MTLKQLLLSRKSGYIKYIIGSFIPIINNLAMTFIFAFLIGVLQDISQLPQTLLLSALIAVGSIILQIISRFLRIGYMRDILMDIRMMAFKKIMNKSYQQFAINSKDTYLSQLVNDINLFEQDFFLSLLNVIVSVGTYIVSVTLLLILDPLIAGLTLLVSLLMLVITRFFEPKVIALKQKVSTANEDFSIYSANALSGLEILKLNQVEDKFFGLFQQKVRTIENFKQRFNLLSETQRVGLENIGFIFTIGISILVSTRLATGQTLTQVALMIQIVNSVIWNLAFVFPLMNRMKASESIYSKITTLDDIDQSHQGTQPFVLNDSITVNNVSFAYQDDLERDILKNVNLKLEKGKKYLLKGASGAGKTTFLQLLSKVFLPTNGSITLDDTNFNEISVNSFNEHVAFIYQSVFLFNDSIRNNITLFDETICEDKLNEAVLKAGLTEFINKLPEGLDTILEENGKNISGGERQRISIARALIKEADILFVDEATSSLDSALGESIEKTLLDLDQMVIAISHRTYEGVTYQYDGVISINNQQAYFYDTKEYFELGGITQ